MTGEGREMDSHTPEPRRGTVVLSNVYADVNKGGAAITEVTGAFARRLVEGSRLVLVIVPTGLNDDDGHGVFAEWHTDDVARTGPMVETPGGIRTLLGLLRAVGTLLMPSLFQGNSDAYAEIGRSEVVISKGGYLFGHRPTRSILGLLVTAYPLLYAWRIGVPTVVYSSSIGPFSSRLHRWAVGVILRRLSVVSVRDTASSRRSLELGVDPSRLVSMPDSVFSWKHGSSDASDLEDRDTRLSIVLRDSEAIREVLPDLEVLLEGLSEAGEFRQFVCVLQSVPDLAITKEFAQRLRARGLEATFVDTSAYHPAELVGVYARSAATISARLHGAIFSLLAGTPAMSISVDPDKAEEVMGVVGLSDWVIPPRADEIGGLDEWLRDARKPSKRAEIRSLVSTAGEQVKAAESEISRIYREGRSA